MEQADDALAAARTLTEAGLPRDAVNRAYYAIFYSVLALLATRQLGSSKHSGALTLFNREFVKTGMLPQDLSRLARRAFEQRLEADYSEWASVTIDEAVSISNQAAHFVNQVRALLPAVLPQS
ncbi:MAG: HEPN domain-containing protein [Bacteroidetes bacterium]|nr:hypothetical protein AWN76_009375 [Rhodothermaceae bacterium RA]RMH61123.1 MAG: HEPN domain-containing protein [Bacteroidota bacterium]